MQTLSKEAERRITTALNEVVDLVNAGGNPTDAMAKVAADRQLPAGHVNLMVNAFNIGRSEAQRKGTADLFEKASEFELADAAEVLDRMFPAAVKSAGVLAEERTVSPQYGTPPRFLADRARREKVAAGAAINWDMGPKPAPLPRDPHTAVKRAHSKLVDHRRAVEETRRAAQFQFDRATGLFDKLAEYLRQPHAPTLADVRESARFTHGEVGVQICDELGRQHRVFAKQAAHGRTDSPVTAAARVGELIEAVESYHLAKAAYDKAAAAQDTVAGEIARPFIPAAPELGSVLGPCSEKRAFLGGLFGTAIGSSIGRAVGDKAFKPTSDLQGAMKNRLTDPQHEAQLRNIQTESMLNDLMANDEVISGYDPHEVTTHFNEISQLSPRATNQSGLMRALLRKRLQQGALDPFEVDMLLKIENNLKTRDNPSPGGVLNGPAGVV